MKLLSELLMDCVEVVCTQQPMKPVWHNDPHAPTLYYIYSPFPGRAARRNITSPLISHILHLTDRTDSPRSPTWTSWHSATLDIIHLPLIIEDHQQPDVPSGHRTVCSMQMRILPTRGRPLSAIWTAQRYRADDTGGLCVFCPYEEQKIVGTAGHSTSATS